VHKPAEVRQGEHVYGREAKKREGKKGGMWRRVFDVLQECFLVVW
jgi:hypothetical protein